LEFWVYRVGEGHSWAARNGGRGRARQGTSGCPGGREECDGVVGALAMWVLLGLCSPSLDALLCPCWSLWAADVSMGTLLFQKALQVHPHLCGCPDSSCPRSPVGLPSCPDLDQQEVLGAVAPLRAGGFLSVLTLGEQSCGNPTGRGRSPGPGVPLWSTGLPSDPPLPPTPPALSSYATQATPALQGGSCQHLAGGYLPREAVLRTATPITASVIGQSG
jgi:hypothetical protein